MRGVAAVAWIPSQRAARRRSVDEFVIDARDGQPVSPRPSLAM